MGKSPVEQIKELAPQARIEMLENEVKTLRKGLEIYERERNRYKQDWDWPGRPHGPERRAD